MGKSIVPAPYQKLAELLKKIQERYKENAKAFLESQTQRRFMEPPQYQGDPLDIADIAKAFERKDLNQLVVQSYTTEKKSGGDFSLGVAQIEMLSQAERGFRSRHLPRIKSFLDAAMRHKAYGDPTGLYGRIYPNYIDRLKRRAAEQEPSS